MKLVSLNIDASLALLAMTDLWFMACIQFRPAKFVHVVYRTRRFEQMLSW
jgi:phage terminase large subunit